MVQRIEAIDGRRRITGQTPYGDYDITINREYDGQVFDASGEPVGVVMIDFHPTGERQSPLLQIRDTPIESNPQPDGQQRVLPPGDWLAMLIQIVTFGLVRPCTSCKSRMAAMNRAGWGELPKLWLRSIDKWMRRPHAASDADPSKLTPQ